MSPAARSELARALSVRAARSVVRLFIEPGIHPRVAMILDAPKVDDLRTESEGIPLVTDAPSVRFLDGAKIDFLTGPAGAGFRVTGPGLPEETPEAPAASAPIDPRRAGGDRPEPGSPEEVGQRVLGELRKLYDPEIPMNIVDLGLIYGLEWKGPGALEIRMTMTSPGCPVIEVLCDEVRAAALRTPGVASATVDVVWDPPWGPEKMTELARRQLGFA